MAGVVVGMPLGPARLQRQERLRPVQGLDLTLLVDAEHQRPIGRVEVEADDVADLVNKEGVGLELEGLGEVRLEAERPPDPRDGGLRQAEFPGHRPRAPVGGRLGLGFEGACHDLIDLIVGDGSRRSGAGFVVQAVEPRVEEPTSPLSDGAAADTDTEGGLVVAKTLGAGENDLGASGEPLGRRGAVCPGLERAPLVIGGRGTDVATFRR